MYLFTEYVFRELVDSAHNSQISSTFQEADCLLKLVKVNKQVFAITLLSRNLNHTAQLSISARGGGGNNNFVSRAGGGRNGKDPALTLLQSIQGMFLSITNCFEWRQLSIIECNKGTHAGRRAVETDDVEVPKILVSMLILLQILLRMLLTQLYTSLIFVIDNLMLSETKLIYV